MQVIKKMIVLLLVAVMTAGIINITLADETDDSQIEQSAEENALPEELQEEIPEEPPAKIIDPAVLDIIGFLSQLDIMNEYISDIESLDNLVTRGEFAIIAAKLLGFEIMSLFGEESLYFDVSNSHSAASSINILSGLNFINGYGEGVYAPDETITWEQAIKILVCILGYEEISKAFGGYPMGYISTASQIGLLKGAKYPYGEPVTRSMFILLIYNALNVDIAESVGFGSNVSYEAKSGENILTKRMNLVKKRGIVTGTNKTYLTAESTLRDGMVDIGGNIYNVGTSSAEKYLGYQVTYYVREDKTTAEEIIVIITAERDANDVVTIEADDIISFSNNTVEFLSGSSRSTKKNIKDKADFIYNGKVDPDFNAEELNIKNGSVVLLDNNNDGLCDVVFVTEYDTIFVDSVNLADNFIVDKNTVQEDGESSATGNSATKILDLDPIEKKVTYLKDGEPAQLKDIRQQNVVSVASSKDNKNITVIISTASVRGTVIEIANGEEFVLDDGETYKLAKDIVNSIGIDDTCTFYLTFDGKIGGIVKLSSASEKYAYLVKYARTGGLLSPCEFKLFTDKGQMLYVKQASNFKLNGKTSPNFETDLVARGIDGEILMENGVPRYDQLVIYRLDSDGNLASIQTAHPGYDSEEFSFDHSQFIEDMPGIKGRIAGHIYNDSTIIMKIPELTEDEKFGVVDSSFFVGGSDYAIDIYDRDEIRLAKIIIVKVDAKSGTTEDIIHETPVAIVENISRAYIDGEEVYKLHAFQNGAKVSFTATLEGAIGIDGKNAWGCAGMLLKDLKFGNVIQYGLNKEGRIDRFKLLFEGLPSLARRRIEHGSDGDPRNEVIFGKVENRSDNFIVIAERVFDISSINVIQFNESKSKVISGNSVLIQKGSVILLHAHQFRAIDAVIYDSSDLLES